MLDPEGRLPTEDDSVDRSQALEPRAGLSATDRLQAIAQTVLARGSASAQELVAEFGVSLMTIHRDLEKLASQGVVRKHHGGVSAQPSGVFESNIAYRRQAMQDAKREVAAHAAQLIEPGMSVMLDDSTTVWQMAPHLPAIQPLYVVTNFLDGMGQLSEITGIDLVGIGGDYDNQHRSFLGIGAADAVRALRVDAVFVSTSAVSGEFSFHQEPKIVLVKRAMLEVATKRYLLIDHTKIGRTALHRLASLSDFDEIIVDSGTPPDALAELDRVGAPYVVARAPMRRHGSSLNTLGSETPR